MATINLNVGDTKTAAVVVDDTSGAPISPSDVTKTLEISDSTILSQPDPTKLAVEAIAPGTASVTVTATPVGGGASVSASPDTFVVAARPIVIGSVTVTWS